MTHNVFSRARSALETGVLALAIVIAGVAIGFGLTRMRSTDHYVTVKGVAERDVQADLAIWPLHLIVADNDLAAAQAKIQGDLGRVRAFLARNGLDTAGVVVQGYAVADARTNQYGQAPANSRFVIRQTMIVRSSNPAAVLAASQRVGELVSAGVVLSSGAEYGGGGPTFLFTGLNALKPAMIGEATARAREAASQFARDAETTLGGIRQANQGVFEILPRDPAPGISEASQVMKRVRVVSTVEYILDS
jgi:hypothetical protein